MFKFFVGFLCLLSRLSPRLSKSKMSTMQQHIEQLLDNYEILRQSSLEISSTSSEMPGPKCVNKSPAVFSPRPLTGSLLPCLDPGCGSLDVIEDVSSGSVVCIQCGLIQATSVFETALTNAQYHEGVSRIAVRRYSRVVYLRSVLRSMCGETLLVFPPGSEQSLRSYFQNDENRQKMSAADVKSAIKKLKLPRRLIFHAQRIAFLLFKTDCPNPSEQEIRDVCARFHGLENAWDRLPLASSLRKGRKKFLSLPVVWEALCSQLKLPHLASLIPPAKNLKLRKKQLLILNELEDRAFYSIH